LSSQLSKLDPTRGFFFFILTPRQIAAAQAPNPRDLFSASS
jgi:hypothetical protein